MDYMRQADSIRLKDSGHNYTLTLKTMAFNLFQEPDNNLWTYDLEGRLIGMFINGINYRRTLGNRFFEKYRVVIKNETFRKVRECLRPEIEANVNKSTLILSDLYNALPSRFRPVVDKIKRMDWKHLSTDAISFKNIYLPISILPPDQYLSLVVQVTEGCNYNQCIFCDFYRDRPFRIKTSTELNEHLHNIKKYFGEGIKMRKSIFLGDANAIVIPQEQLIKTLRSIKNVFPHPKDIYSFIDVFTGVKKDSAAFLEMRELGLKRVYLGIESGNNELMTLLKKPQDRDGIINLAGCLKNSGINMGLIFLSGIGGPAFAEKHMQDSISILKDINLSRGDIVYISEYTDRNPQYFNEMDKLDLTPATDLEIRHYTHSLKSAIKDTVSTDIQISIYDIGQFFY
jgi:radical SAM superfamily enzyme YgiQ (UPF0313 family)